MPCTKGGNGPRLNLDGPERFNDIGYLEIPKDLLMHCAEEGRVNTGYLSELTGRNPPSRWGIPRLDYLSTLCIDRSHWVLASELGLQVAKVSAATGRATGIWIGVADAIPENEDWWLSADPALVLWNRIGYSDPDSGCVPCGCAHFRDLEIQLPKPSATCQCTAAKGSPTWGCPRVMADFSQPALKGSPCQPAPPTRSALVGLLGFRNTQCR